jgi:hypothetical protein
MWATYIFLFFFFMAQKSAIIYRAKNRPIWSPGLLTRKFGVLVEKFGPLRIVWAPEKSLVSDKSFDVPTVPKPEWIPNNFLPACFCFFTRPFSSRSKLFT